MKEIMVSGSHIDTRLAQVREPEPRSTWAVGDHRCAGKRARRPDGRLMRRDGSPLDAATTIARNRLSNLGSGTTARRSSSMLDCSDMTPMGICKCMIGGSGKCARPARRVARAEAQAEIRCATEAISRKEKKKRKPQRFHKFPATFQEVPQVSDAFQNVPYKTKTETKTKSENMRTLQVAQTRRTARPKLTNHSR